MLYCFVLKVRTAVSTPMNALKVSSLKSSTQDSGVEKDSGVDFKQTDVQLEYKARVDSLCLILGQTLQSVSWILAEFYFNRGLQRPYTGTCIILQKTINGFLCLLIVFLKSKTYQLILKDVIKLNRNLG